MDYAKKEISRAVGQGCQGRPRKRTLRMKRKVKNEPVLHSPGEDFLIEVITDARRAWCMEAAVAGTQSPEKSVL